ncbi:MAG: EamA family transporter RarD [Parvularculaceae bacterium]|nr:EamA family transporter RarD [Parvularculaceae bacterium]
MTGVVIATGPAAERRLGLICGVAAYAIWGLFPIYIRELDPAGAVEVVAHRIAWSVPFGAAILALRRQWPETWAALKSPRIVALLGLSAFLISINWLVYVWAVANDRVLQASLGYYINPLLFIAAGVFVLKEKLSLLQGVAVALAGAGVLALIVGAGVVPWPSFILAVSFTAYGFVRKTTPVGAMPGLFIETLLLAPFALATLAFLANSGALQFGKHGAGLDALLIAAGPMTVGPLVLFALAARRLSLTTVGFLQYIGPTGQFLLGVYYGEPFTTAHAICFGLIWSALALTSVDAVRRNRAPAKESLTKSV